VLFFIKIAILVIIAGIYFTRVDYKTSHFKHRMRLL
jgi:hypothetical protein